jgi:hypothetical protein
MTSSSPPDLPSLRVRLARRFTARQFAGLVALTCAFGVTIAVAVWGTSSHPPSAAGAAALTVLAGALQVGGAWAFSRDRRVASEEHAETSASNLIRLLAQVESVKLESERLVRKRQITSEELRRHVAAVSLHSEFMEQRAADALAVWQMFYPEAVDKAMRAQREATDE